MSHFSRRPLQYPLRWHWWVRTRKRRPLSAFPLGQTCDTVGTLVTVCIFVLFNGMRLSVVIGSGKESLLCLIKLPPYQFSVVRTRKLWVYWPNHYRTKVESGRSLLLHVEFSHYHSLTPSKWYLEDNFGADEFFDVAAPTQTRMLLQLVVDVEGCHVA